ncbi:putative aminopeptidase P [Trypanosoma cruzi]|uniref:Putative aminopeptidase P n=1 Tax=Trypanosoma cruzi TaxID=5693 RepID=A0A2V2W2Q2_TRYCR|nr:putative aminopeptidase P [Trypanosoma cruzi]
MQHCKPGMSQHHLESTFLHYVYYHGGCRKVAYTCICGTGHHGAVLHYPNNDAPVEDGSMALLDMGGHYMGYASDITCSFPVNGKFTEDQRIIYNAVLDAHDSVMRQLKPGVNWVDMHKLALRVMCEHLVRAGILLGDVDTIMENVLWVFFNRMALVTSWAWMCTTSVVTWRDAPRGLKRVTAASYVWPVCWKRDFA